MAADALNCHLEGLVKDGAELLRLAKHHRSILRRLLFKMAEVFYVILKQAKRG